MKRSISACVATISLVAFAACSNVGDVFSGGDVAGEAGVESDSVLPPIDEDTDLTPGDGLPSDPVECPGPVDFETDGNGLALVAGQPITGLPALGITSVMCINNDPSHPNSCIIFDSANPTGGDVDLGTPNETLGGPGVGLGGELGQVGVNDVAENNVLIIAENVHDCELNGLVDDPDDEAAGGVIGIAFAEVSTVNSITLLDIDNSESGLVEVLLDGGGSVSVPFQLLGDNSRQTVDINVSGAVGINVHLAASGAIAQLDFCPDPPDGGGGSDCVNDQDCGDIDLFECNLDGQCVDKPATLSGLVFLDNDGNGLFQTGVNGIDVGLGNIQVALYLDNDQNGVPDSSTPFVPTVQSAAGTGAYTFSGLDPFNKYLIHCQDLSSFGYLWSPANAGNDDIDSDILASGYTATIVTAPGDEKGNIYCGIMPPTGLP